MEKLDEKAFEIDIGEKAKHTFKTAIKEVQKIAEVQTPRAKLQQLGAAIVIIEHAYSLYKGESSNADVLVEFLPYMLVKAKIDRLLAHYNYIEAFHLATNEGDPIEVYRTNLKIAIQRVWDFKLEGYVPSFGGNAAKSNKLQNFDELNMNMESHIDRHSSQASVGGSLGVMKRPL